ncbi:GntR family transcriptional regulator [Gulosibacter chungangensis]|uniref:GntR family transcriptional regulator n=1 Tax=Gulosibacter chungangensis TaxID=979746 RepID=A0A7J5BAQ8_9MICO|nr:GntR family transcriptional regulator [Gulosibacter chungangensis]KAB1642544.1 GntR family transcriptional regulator [Gulosibacter chungangensis]
MSTPTDISLQRRSTAEVVSDTLMRLIVEGELKAGAPLRESSLATRLGISRNSLREGIRLLEQSRLVKYEVHRGAVVSTPTLKDLDDLYRTRLMLETMAVQEIPSPEALEEVERTFEQLKESVESKEVEPIVNADLAFHHAIVGLLESERLSAFYEQISKEMIFYFTVLSYADEEYANPDEPILARHTEIVEAIRRGRRAEASELVTAHIMANFARLKEILQERLEESETT